VGLGPGTGAAADDYLQAIEAEGGRLKVVGKARQEQERLRRAPPPAAAGRGAQAAATQASGAANGVGAFELALRQDYPGSYALYALLDAGEKDQVYGEYQQSRGEGAARYLPVVNRIITLTTAKNRARAAGR
jgi:hypothetical protein